jgi:Aminoglycoside-2''-adenylyltransferase
MDFASFQAPLWAATVMNAFERPWCIAGGWAIDLWLERPTRDHGDVEIAILRDDQLELRDFLDDGTFYIATPGGNVRWRDRQLLMLPIHEFHVDLQHHDLEVLLNEHDTEEWVYRRDGRVRMPIRNWIVRGGFGVPVIAPEIALLYKSKKTSAKDDLDFHSAVGALNEGQREFLANALMLTAPGHPWLAELQQLA